MPTEKPRFTLIMDEKLLELIDDFRFENRYPSRSAAAIAIAARDAMCAPGAGMVRG